MPVKFSRRTAATDARPAAPLSSAEKPRPYVELGSLDSWRFSRPRRYRGYLVCRTVGDGLLALLLLVLTLPILLVAAVLVRITSRGPAFYSQTRVGKNGRPFTIFKLRTMVHKCESLTGARWAIPGDPRITRVGHFLRVSHLDELPQLLNVLRGEMSLIGPRPERPEFLPELERAIPWYRERLLVRPGVTGLAQVHLPGDTDVYSVRRKLAYDLYYIEQFSPWLDLRILLCTAFYAVGVPFRVSRRLLCMPAAETAENFVHAARAESAKLAA